MDSIVDRISFLLGDDQRSWRSRYTEPITQAPMGKPVRSPSRYENNIGTADPSNNSTDITSSGPISQDLLALKAKQRHRLNRYTGEGLQPWMFESVEFFIDEYMKPEPNKDPDPDELKMGIEIEMEHTTDEKLAERIARHHLQEISDYYTRLKKMENEAGITD